MENEPVARVCEFTERFAPCVQDLSMPIVMSFDMPNAAEKQKRYVFDGSTPVEIDYAYTINDLPPLNFQIKTKHK